MSSFQPLVPRSPQLQAFLQASPLPFRIGGQPTRGTAAGVFERHDPATGEPLGSVHEADAQAIDAAVAAARRAFEAGEWPQFDARDRAQALRRVAAALEDVVDTLAELVSLEQGKPLSLARQADVGGAIEYCHYYAALLESGVAGHWRREQASSLARHRAYLLRQPIGVVAAIVPWNSPIVLAAAKFAPALAAGCTVVLKPSEHTSLSTLFMAQAIEAAQLPAGVFNVVTGQGPGTGHALAAHADVDFVAFTGSTATGREILAAARGNLKRVALELGGKSPVIVFEDAAVEAAIEGICRAIFANSGQVCVAGSRLYVHADLHRRVLDGVVNRAESLRLGHGLNPDTDLGPLITPAAAARVFAEIDAVRAVGATIHCGGTRAGPCGSFVEPTVVSGMPEDCRLMREEIFGPVLAVQPFETLEQVRGLADDSPYGLSASIWSEDLERAQQLAARLRVGTVWINTHGIFAASLPNGGMKQSGWGRDGGLEGLEQYLDTKTVCAST